MTTRPLVDGPRMVVARLSPWVALTQGEAIEACQVLADADRALSEAGRPTEARALGTLFELVEDRLAPGCGEVRSPGPVARPDQPWSGWYSRDSELTQYR
jgi:hypothetical protein